MSSDFPDATSPCKRLVDWILDGPAILRAGPQRGGVCGWIDARGPVFVYGEAAGYCLTALTAASHLHPVITARAKECANLVVSWIEGHVRHGDLPATRIYLRPHSDDWRCDQRFAFDLAMLARGLHDATALLPSERLRPLVARVVAEIETLVDDRGNLRPCRSSRAALEPPSRWSTRAGFYQLKIAAALLTRPLALPDLVATACQRIVDQWTEVPPLNNDLHPYLYGLEGSVLLSIATNDRERLERTGEALRRVVDLQLRHGHLSVERGSAPPRTDIVAQTLRLMALLANAADLNDGSPLRAILERSIDQDGAVLFDATAQSHRNVWATLFTWQALAWHTSVRTGQPVPTRDARLLV